MNYDDELLLASLHSGTAADLDHLLDVDAGLREVLIAAQHNHTKDDLDLDIEAGLRAIAPALEDTTLPDVHPVTQPQQPDPTPHPPHLQSAVATKLMSMDSNRRLALRNDPAIIAFALSLAVICAKTTSKALVHFFTFARARDDERDLLGILSRVLDRALYRANDLARGRALDRELDRELDRARELASTPILAGDRALALALALELALALALDITRARTLDLVSARALDFDFARAVELDFDRAQDRAYGLSRALDLNSARAFDLDLARARALDFARAYALDLDLDLDLDRARHDFTEADLSGVDLSTVSLTGVRWSMATRWPSEEWRAQALLNSRELNDGTYEIQSGSTNVPIHST